jgi:hypothetical protein
MNIGDFAKLIIPLRSGSGDPESNWSPVGLRVRQAAGSESLSYRAEPAGTGPGGSGGVLANGRLDVGPRLAPGHWLRSLCWLSGF